MVGLLKCLSKSELADMMGIHRNTLMKWINKDPIIVEELKNAKYNKQQKLFTPLQVRIIYKKFLE